MGVNSPLLLRGEGGVGGDVKELLGFFINQVFVGVFQYDSGTPKHASELNYPHPNVNSGLQFLNWQTKKEENMIYRNQHVLKEVLADQKKHFFLLRHPCSVLFNICDPFWIRFVFAACLRLSGRHTPRLIKSQWGLCTSVHYYWGLLILLLESASLLQTNSNIMFLTTGAQLSGAQLSRGPTIWGPIVRHKKVDSWAPYSLTMGPNCLGPNCPPWKSGHLGPIVRQGPTVRGPSVWGLSVRGPSVWGPTVQGPTVRGSTAQGPICLGPLVPHKGYL